MKTEIKNVISHYCGNDPASIQDTDSLKDDLSFDSLDFVECVMELETVFNVSINDEEMDNLVTVNDVFTYIEGKANG